MTPGHTVVEDQVPPAPDQVVCLAPFEFHAMVGGRLHGPWGTRGAALAGLAVEQRRALARKAGQPQPRQERPAHGYADRMAELAGLLRQARDELGRGSSPRACSLTAEIDRIEEAILAAADSVAAHYNRWLPHRPDFDLDRLCDLSRDTHEIG